MNPVNNYSCNITFVCSNNPEKNDYVDLITEWIRSVALRALFNAESPAKNPALRRLLEAGGEKIPDDHGSGLALHADFDSLEAFRQWHEVFLLPVLGEFSNKFGFETPYFVTLLENLPL